MIVKLRVANGKHEGTTYLVHKSPYLIGRHDQADLRIGNPQVSVQHCVVIIRGTEVWIRDLGSTNGTYVNEEVLDGERRLGVSDVIQIGPALFEVIQEATGFLRDVDREGYTPTPPVLPALPNPPKVAPARATERVPRPGTGLGRIPPRS